MDLGDGKLQELQRVYDSRVSMVGSLSVVQTRHGLEVELRKCIDSLADDIPFPAVRHDLGAIRTSLRGLVSDEALLMGAST